MRWDTDNPCSRDCKDRRVGCHGNCTAYAKYRQQLEAQKQALAQEKATEYELKSFKIECIYKTRRSNGHY